MMLTTSAHCTVEESGDALRLILPYRPRRSAILSLAVVLIVFIGAGAPFVLEALAGTAPWPLATLLICFLIGTLWLVELLWQVAGKEVVEISAEAIAIRHQIFGWGVTRACRADNINGVFVSRQKDGECLSLLSGETGFLNFKSGAVALNSGPARGGDVQTFRFGSILTEEEAKQIVAAIHGRFPQYRYTPKKGRSPR